MVINDYYWREFLARTNLLSNKFACAVIKFWRVIQIGRPRIRTGKILWNILPEFGAQPADHSAGCQIGDGFFAAENFSDPCHP
jgi:hypothetical protein